MTGEPFAEPDAALRARLYAALHRGNDGDVEFYVRRCRARRRLRVLELGAGNLRIALRLAQAGHYVTAVEIDAGLYQLAEERLQALSSNVALELVHMDMLDFRSKVPFDKVLIPYSTFWCLPSDEHKRKCLDVVSRLLAPGGELILDVYPADDLYGHTKGRKNASRREPLIDEFELTEHSAEIGPNQQFRVFERNSLWPSKKHTRVEYGLESKADVNLRWLLTLDHHYLWRHELAQMLDVADFETEWGSDDEAPGSAFERQIIVRATAR